MQKQKLIGREKERAAFDRKLSDIRDTFGGSKAFVSKLKEAGL